jgi:hypothetical protein
MSMNLLARFIVTANCRIAESRIRYQCQWSKLVHVFPHATAPGSLSHTDTSAPGKTLRKLSSQASWLDVGGAKTDAMQEHKCYLIDS